MESRFYPAPPLLAAVRDLMVARELGNSSATPDRIGALANEVLLQQLKIEQLRRELDGLVRSPSWRITAPLRAAKARAAALAARLRGRH